MPQRTRLPSEKVETERCEMPSDVRRILACPRSLLQAANCSSILRVCDDDKMVSLSVMAKVVEQFRHRTTLRSILRFALPQMRHRKPRKVRSASSNSSRSLMSEDKLSTGSLACKVTEAFIDLRVSPTRDASFCSARVIDHVPRNITSAATRESSSPRHCVG